MTQIDRNCRMMTRRGLIATGIAALALHPVGAAALDAAPAPRRDGSQLDRIVSHIPPELDLFNPHTNDRAKVRFFTAEGYDPAAVEKLNFIWRDWREKEVVQADVRLWWALAAIRAAAIKDGHSGEIVLLSGFRTRKTNNLLRKRGKGAAYNSFHLRARAADITIPGIPVKVVAKYAQWLEVGGIGRYDRSKFVHLDTGPIRSWVS